jgi:hypothetical protein
MLPKNFYTEPKLSLEWDCKYDLEKLMPFLRRKDIYLKFNEIEIRNANIINDKESRIVSFLLNS